MAPPSDSIPVLIRSVLDDAHKLIREEIELARVEIRSELYAARAAGASFGGAALVGMIGLMLFCIALGGAIADVFDLPAWMGYGIMAMLLSTAAYVLVRLGRRQFNSVRGLPETKAGLQENIAWMQRRSASE